jgi:hypothetical protein
VYGPRHQLLSRAALPRDESGRLVAPQHFDHPEEVPHGLAGTHEGPQSWSSVQFLLEFLEGATLVDLREDLVENGA